MSAPHLVTSWLGPEARRVETWGWSASIAFAVYWLVVAPFSGLIRRELLRVAQRRAEGAQGPRLVR